MSGSPFGIGEFWATENQTDAYEDASDNSYKTAQQQLELLRDMFDQQVEWQQPYMDIGKQGAEMLPDTIPPYGDAATYAQQIGEMEGPNLPQLNLGDFSYQFDPNDPTYQYRQQEMQKTIDQAAAARGGYNSRAAINALSEGNMALTADESYQQFQRALGTYGANTQADLSQYSADYGRATDLYNAERGNLTDLYNMATQMGMADYNQVIDMLKIGQGAASTAGMGAQNYGNQGSAVYGNLANVQNQLGIAEAASWSNFVTGLGNSFSPSNVFGGAGSMGGVGGMASMFM